MMHRHSKRRLAVPTFGGCGCSNSAGEPEDGTKLEESWRRCVWYRFPVLTDHFELVERQIPEPGAGSVRIQLQACGICHSDSLTKDGAYPGIQYPRVPGHEVAGVIDAVGPGIAGWQPGQQVGVGWNGGYCGHCDPIQP